MPGVADGLSCQDVAEGEFRHPLLEVVVGVPGGDTEDAGGGPRNCGALRGQVVREYDVAGDGPGEEPEVFRVPSSWEWSEHREGLLGDRGALGERAVQVVHSLEQSLIVCRGYFYRHVFFTSRGGISPASINFASRTGRK